MKNLMMALIVGVLLYAGSAAASWYLMNQQPEPMLAESELEEASKDITPIGVAAEKQPQLPVGVRPDLPLTVETVLELSESIRRKEQELIDREKAIEKSEQNIKMLFEDLKIERAELNALMEGIETKLRVAQNSTDELRLENQQLATKTEELAKLNQRKAQQQADGEPMLDEIGQRVKTAKPWFEGLEDEQAANYLKEFANNGELQFAVRLLKSLQQRKASKILAAFNDPEFVQQLLGALADEGEGKGEGAGQAASEARRLDRTPLR